jgi:hypothetical protein
MEPCAARTAAIGADTVSFGAPSLSGSMPEEAGRTSMVYHKHNARGKLSKLVNYRLNYTNLILDLCTNPVGITKTVHTQI